MRTHSLFCYRQNVEINVQLKILTQFIKAKCEVISRIALKSSWVDEFWGREF